MSVNVREYISHIYENYENLPDKLYFPLGKINHDIKYSIHLIENGTDKGHVYDNVYIQEKLDVKEWFSKYIDPEINLNLPIKMFYTCSFCAQKEEILSRTKEYYKMILDMIPPDEQNPEIIHYLDRSWYYMFNMHKTPRNFQVYCAYHDSPLSKEVTDAILNVYNWMIPYKLNSTLAFENEVVLKMDVDMTKKYVGQITYNFALSKSVLFNYINIDTLLENQDSDVVTFFHNPHDKIKNIHLLSGPKFLDIWTRLLRKLLPEDTDILSDSIQLFYCNYWVTKPEIMKEYQEFNRKASLLLEEDPDVYEDSGYPNPTNVPKERLAAISGKPYYTYHSFIIERLPCVFFWYKGYTIHHANLI